MSLEYIRDRYDVPAEVGRQIDFAWPPGEVRAGTIVGAVGAHLLVEFDGEASVPLHPTWNVTYRSGGVSGSSHE